MSKHSTPFSGPRRLILIQSGKYDYAELDLTQSFQLVGVNGLGKTALISTLQYLYIDSQRDMRFGQHSTDDSRRFYFRSDSSFILFECETPLGVITVGARSLGPTAGYELQRFAWNGGFHRDDFIAENGRPKNWDEVRPRLGIKELRIIADSIDLRRLLGAVDEETTSTWGLVPLAEAKDYPRFRQTFQRLLQLRDIRQDDLKHLLADCAKLGPSQREIDLAKDFEKELGRIERDRTEVKRLTAARPSVEEIRKLFDKEVSARGQAHAGVKELHRRHAGYAKWFKDETDALHQVIKAAREKEDALKIEKQELQRQIQAASEETGKISERIRLITLGRERFASFIPEFEAQACTQLGDEVANLEERLRNIPLETIETLTAQLTSKQAELSRQKLALDRLADLFVTWLRDRIPKEEVARLGALMNRNVLISVMDEQIQVLNEADLIDRLRKVAAQCDVRGYSDDTVSIEFPRGAIADASEAGNKEKLEASIRSLEREIARLERDIETVKNAEPFRLRLKEAGVAYKAKLKYIATYEEFCEEAEKADEYSSQLESQAKRIAELGNRMGQVESDHAGVRSQAQAAIDKFNDVTGEQDEIRKHAANMPTADGDDPGPTPLSIHFIESLPQSLLETFRVVRQKCADGKSLARELNDKMSLLDRDFVNASFLYDTSGQVETKLTQLEVQIASLQERTQNIEHRWTAVLSDAKRCFHTLLKSLDAVHKEVRKLNGELSEIEFSSLASVRLEVVQNSAAVSEYERHAKDSNQPSLFDTAEEADQKLSQFRRVLESRPKLSLHDLYSLRCEVIRKDGQKNFYDDFDAVESTGTTIVLKVTLNLLVLRDLLLPGKARIPFYLDEVHALDRQNFGNILQLSEKLGFIGVYAAPTAAIGPRRFVHLVPDKRGRLVVTSTHRKDIIREPGETTENGSEGNANG